MSRDWEQTFRSWTKPSSDTEVEKCENAERMVRDAIKTNDNLKKRDLSIFAQGSYRNNTNVINDSDVDICVCCNETFISDYSLAPHLNDTITGSIPATYLYPQFKSELEQALINKLGTYGVIRREKAFDIKPNSYRVELDVVPAIQSRKYHPEGTFITGTRIYSDSGLIIDNWPEQHYTNGVDKNKQTNNRFKFITRVMKRLRNEMTDSKINAAVPIPSYLIECLVFNVPNYLLAGDSYTKNVKEAIRYIYEITTVENKCTECLEVNNIKYLFRDTQKWKREEVNAFMQAAWTYINA